MIKTPLYSKLKKLNANFADIGNYIIPINYGNAQDEINKVRNELGLIDLSNRGKLVFSGKEHLKLLQGMLTNDIIELENDKGIYANLLTVKGKMLSDMRVFKSNDSVYMDLEPGMNPEIKNIFEKYKLSYKADILDVTNQYGLLHICGPECRSFIQTIFNIDNNSFEELNHEEKENIRLMKINRTGETGYDILFKNEHSENIWNRINNSNYVITPFGYDSLETLRIEAGIPVYGKDMDDSTIPIEADLWHSLNFEKGCYIGQEVIARIKWRGKVNWHLIGLIVDGNELPLKGDKLSVNGKNIGRITSSTYSPALKSIIALGYIRREYKDYRDKVNLNLENDIQTTAQISDKTFYNNFI